MSDEPTTTTLLVLGAIGAGAAASEQSRKSASRSASKAQNRSAEAAQRNKEDLAAAANKTTATPVGGLSEQAKKTRRIQASTLSRQFAPPTLAQPGLTGA